MKRKRTSSGLALVVPGSGALNWVVLIGLLQLGCAAEPAAESDSWVLEGGLLFDAVGTEVRPNPGIVIQGNRIVAMGGVGVEEALGRGARVVEIQEGEVILPGFIDLHAHYHVDLLGEGRIDETEVYPSLFLANGVTSTFPAGEMVPDRMARLKERIEAGEAPGPRVLRSGAYFGTARPDWNPDITPDQIREQVDYWASQGVSGFKAKGITPEHLAALVEQAALHDLTVTGHLDSGFRTSVNPRDAIHMGISRIEHFMGGDAMTPDRSAYASLVSMHPDMPEFERIVQTYLDNGTYFDATLSAYGYFGERDPAVYEYFQDEKSFLTPYAREIVEERAAARGVNQQFERIYWVKQDLVKRFFDRGGADLITLGTDHPSWGEFFSGFSVHRELHAFVRAGIPEAYALRFGTINPARAMGLADDLGTIEAGKLADLVVVAGNPLEDIRNTRNVRMVIKDGARYDPSALLSAVRGRLGPTGPDDLGNW